jgi:phosphate transport system protein
MAIPREGHTFQRYDGELSHLHYLVLEMGGLALAQVKDAREALCDRDLSLAQQVIAREKAVDAFELRADSAIVQLIALRTPVGGDLRLVFAVSKSITDLERIGDEAARIANIGVQLFGHDGADPSPVLLHDIASMGALAIGQLENAMRVVDQWDPALAEELLDTHEELDYEFQAAFRRLMTFIMEDARNIGFAVNIVLIIKAFERIGEHAQNLAEYVIYQNKGRDVRHQDEHHRVG